MTRNHRTAFIVTVVVLLTVLSVGGWALWRYVIPKHEAIYTLSADAATEAGAETEAEASAALSGATETEASAADSGASGEPVVTDNSYESDTMQITVTTVTEEDLVYYVADIILSDASLLKTVFAQDSFGQNITEEASDIAERVGAILAVNGDYYGWRDDGIIIRNGELYRNEPVRDMLALYDDGTMKTLREEDYASDEAIAGLLADGVVQTFSFGPSLIEGGQISSGLGSSSKYLSRSHPRTAIGMIEPCHFVLVVVDGRVEDSDGVTLEGLAAIMYDLGCVEAYNLDGGDSSVMIFNGEQLSENEPRVLSDMIYFAAS